MMRKTRPISFSSDPETEKILDRETEKRAMTRSSFLRALIRAFASGRVSL